MSMKISGNPDGSFQVSVRDEGASLCGEDNSGEPIMAAEANGSGLPDNYVLVIEEMIYVCEESDDGTNVTEVLTYDPSTDTISDDWEVVWNRE